MRLDKVLHSRWKIDQRRRHFNSAPGLDAACRRGCYNIPYPVLESKNLCILTQASPVVDSYSGGILPEPSI